MNFWSKLPALLVNDDEQEMWQAINKIREIFVVHIKYRNEKWPNVKFSKCDFWELKSAKPLKSGL